MQDGSRYSGLTLEGEIVAGDADKLLHDYLYYGVNNASNIFLFSKGGDVEEAIKIGRLIRKLRLRTNTSFIDITGKYAVNRINPVIAKNKENNICASACFLIYAGGVEHLGNNSIILHRPYLNPELAKSIQDSDHEAAQIEIMNKVRGYLVEMEVAPEIIAKMMNTSSKDGYRVSESEMIEYHLIDTPPSIEEITLTKCNPPTREKIESFENKTMKEEDRMPFIQSLSASSDCRREAIDAMRSRAWETMHEQELKDKCAQYSVKPEDFSKAKNIAKNGGPKTEAEVKLINDLSNMQLSLFACQGGEEMKLRYEAEKHTNLEYEKMRSR